MSRSVVGVLLYIYMQSEIQAWIQRWKTVKQLLEFHARRTDDRFVRETRVTVLQFSIFKSILVK